VKMQRSTNKTFETNPNATYGVNPNETFKVNPNQTYNATGPNRTFNAARNQTFDAAPNVTFNTAPNATFNAAPNSTYDVTPNMLYDGSTNWTFAASRHPYKTFNASGKSFKANQTFDLNSSRNRDGSRRGRRNKTINVIPDRISEASRSRSVQPNRTRNVGPNKTFNRSRSVSVHPAVGPSTDFPPVQSNDERVFYATLEILCTDIRSFITSMYMFFCNNYRHDCRGVRNVLAEVDTTTQTIINDILVRQIEIDDQREATNLTTMNSSYDEDFEDLSNSFHNSTFDESSAMFQENEQRRSQSLFNATKNRLSTLNINKRHVNSLVEGIRNVEQTERNLQKFRNMEDLRDIFGTEDDEE
jgi:hypothetical protein